VNVKVQKKLIVKVLKGLAWLSLSVLTMLILIILLIRMPYIQNRIIQKAVAYVEQKIGTPVKLESLYIEFPKKIVLKGLYLEDQQADTLVFTSKLAIDTDLWSLLQQRVLVNQIDIHHSVVGIRRQEDSEAFNFDYIVKAFASDSVETEPSPWTFAVDDIRLTHSSIAFHDHYEGNILDIRLDTFDLAMEEFDLARSLYKISAIDVSDMQASLTQSKENAVDTTNQQTHDTTSIPFDFDVDKIRLNRVTLTYSHEVEKKNITVSLGQFTLESNKIDLQNKLIDLDRIHLSQANIGYEQGKLLEEKVLPKPDTGSQTVAIDFGWTLKLKALHLDNNHLRYDDYNASPHLEGPDYNHISLSAVTVVAEDIAIGAHGMKATVVNLSGKEAGGFSLALSAARVALTDTSFELHDFNVASGNSKLAITATASFPSLSDTPVTPEAVHVRLDIQNSTLAVQDILYFNPTLTDSLPVVLPQNTTLFMNTQLHGTLDDLTINQLQVKTFDSTSLMLTGTVKGLPDWKRARIQAELNHFRTTRADINRILPDTVLPPSVQVPGWMELQGNFRGTVMTPQVDATLTSDVGLLKVAGKFDVTSVETYDAVISTKNLNVGKLTGQEDAGTLSMKVALKGSGLTPETLDAVVEATIFEFHYRQYAYKDLLLSGALKNYFFSGTASLSDKNLDFVLKGDLDYQHDIALYKFNFQLKNVDLKELNFSERPLKASANLDVDLATNDFKIMNGTVSIRKFALYNGNDLYRVDSLLFASYDQDGESTISIRSDILTGDFTGTINLFSLPATLEQHINQYFSMQDTTLTAFAKPQNFKFLLTLKNTDLLTEIILPELEPFVPGKIQGEFDSEQNVLTIDIEVSEIQYASAGVDSLSIKVRSDKAALNYKLRVTNAHLGTQHIDALELAGKVANDSIYNTLMVLDSLAEKKYVLGGVMRSLDNGFRFHFDPRQVILNYQKWEVPLDNYIQFGGHTLRAHNFALSHEREKIAILTGSADSSVLFRFQQFQLATLTQLVTGVVPASGEVNGDLKLATLNQSEFSSTLQVNRFALLEKTWGDVVVALNHTRGIYTLDLSIKGDQVNAQALGHYNTKPLHPEFDLSVELSPFNLSLVEPLSFGALKNLEGLLKGNLKITGTVNQPSVRGQLQFSQTSFVLTYLNTAFTLPNETISFEETGVVFRDFKIQDSRRNEAVVRGSIRTRAYQAFTFNVSVNARNFQLLNTREGDNELYYGTVRTDAVVNITGSSTEPKADMTIRIREGTALTYVIPPSERNVLEQKGIVQFVDKHATDSLVLTLQDTTHAVFTGLNLTAKIELTDAALFNVVIDPLTGDMLAVRGNASLMFDMDASGNMNLFGRYELARGAYSFTFSKLMKREFEIAKGSSITWSGDPLNATLDIQANYEVMAPPLDLVYNQISGASPAETNSLSQRMPILVYLYLKGKLMTPDISFKLDMPENKRNESGGVIYAKLLDINTRESELNKQVFSLLVLRRFMADNPFETQASSVGNTARMSVSRMLSEQLNRLSENVKGVQLSFDLRSYETLSGDEPGGQTKVQLGVSKNLLNDRLVVKLSGNVNIEGESEGSGNATDYIGDLALEYKLTSDGSLRVTGFRLSNYDMINGEITETGAGLIFIKDYNTLRELFRVNGNHK
jgi:translocation and assembly module TamB